MRKLDATLICIVAIALFIFAPNVAFARATTPVKRCCIWDPTRVFTCMVYCSGGAAANTGSSQTRALSKTKGNTKAGVTTSGTKAK